MQPACGAAPPSRAFPTAVLTLLILAIAALELWPICAFQYFPSQDGPSHLYNATLLAWYGDWPLAREYFEIRFPAAGNLLTNVILAALVRLFGPQLAEKLLLSAILPSYPAAAWFLLRLFPGAATEFALRFFVLGRGIFFSLGFWNFCAGTGAMLLMAGLAAKWRQQPGKPVAAGIAAASGAIYFCHSLAWAAAAAGALIYRLASGAARFLYADGGEDRVAGRAAC